jgi:lysophospholipid acyltransferase (LPLAT)-like uncharacterized protein
MKQLVRSSLVQRSLAAMFSGYLRFVRATLRWSHQDRERVEAIWAKGGGVIICLWHANIPLSPFAWEYRPGVQEMRALISRSADGEFIARTMEKLGVPAIRGSRKKLSNPAKEKGGGEALRDMALWVKSGGAIAITPDGPHGPARIMGEGAPLLAKLTRAPVLLLGIACRPCLRLPSWDRSVLPLPFGKASFVWDGPFELDREADAAAVAADWTARLDAVTDRAEALVA